MLKYSEKQGTLKFPALYWGNWKLESPKIHVSKLRPRVGGLRVLRAEGFEGNAQKPEVSIFEWCVSWPPVPLPSRASLWSTDPPSLIPRGGAVWMSMWWEWIRLRSAQPFSKFMWKRTTWLEVAVLSPAFYETLFILRKSFFHTFS